MADVCDEFVDAAVLLDAHRVGVGIRLGDTMVIDDALIQGVRIAVSDAAVANDAHTVTAGSLLADTGVFADAHTAMVSTVHTYADSAVLEDRVISALTVTIAESATLNDAHAVRIAVAVADAAVLDDLHQPFAAVAMAHVDAARVDDRYISARVDTLAEAAVLNDAAAGTARSITTVTDAAVLDDSHGVLARATALVMDAATANDAHAATAAGGSLISDEAVLDDRVFQASVGLAWTAASDTLGISQYLGVPFVAAASIGGEHIGILDTGGAYALAGDDDDGTPIGPWRISTGLLDFGKDLLKRPELVYVGYTAQTPIILGLAATQGEGQEIEYEYELPDRAADAPVASRFKPGRGVLSRYYRVTLSSDAAPFALHSLRAVMLDSTRRV